MIKLKESLLVPCEGIFWIINNKLVAFTDNVNPKDPYETTDLLHKEVWKTIGKDYPVDRNTVSFDYFPRGRVETLVIQNTDGSLNHYEASIYMDKCIENKFKPEIEETFRLYLPKVQVKYIRQLFIDGSHYTCHNCRDL